MLLQDSKYWRLADTSCHEEVNLANDAEAMAAGKHSGWVATALDGLEQTLGIADEKGVKIIINGGGLNPKGLAEKTQEMVIFSAAVFE